MNEQQDIVDYLSKVVSAAAENFVYDPTNHTVQYSVVRCRPQFIEITLTSDSFDEAPCSPYDYEVAKEGLPL